VSSAGCKGRFRHGSREVSRPLCSLADDALGLTRKLFQRGRTRTGKPVSERKKRAFFPTTVQVDDARNQRPPSRRTLGRSCRRPSRSPGGRPPTFRLFVRCRVEGTRRSAGRPRSITVRPPSTRAPDRRRNRARARPWGEVEEHRRPPRAHLLTATKFQLEAGEQLPKSCRSSTDRSSSLPETSGGLEARRAGRSSIAALPLPRSFRPRSRTLSGVRAAVDWMSPGSLGAGIRRPERSRGAGGSLRTAVFSYVVRDSRRSYVAPLQRRSEGAVPCDEPGDQLGIERGTGIGPARRRREQDQDARSTRTIRRRSPSFHYTADRTIRPDRRRPMRVVVTEGRASIAGGSAPRPRGRGTEVPSSRAARTGAGGSPVVPVLSWGPDIPGWEAAIDGATRSVNLRWRERFPAVAGRRRDESREPSRGGGPPRRAIREGGKDGRPSS